MSAPHPMSSHAQKPIGTVAVPALLCALTGTLLSVGLEFLGYFQTLEEWLSAVWHAEPFYLNEPLVVLPQTNWAVAFFVSWLVALAVLDSANLWRRLLIGAMSLVVLLGTAPTLVLWNVEWIPLVPVFSLMWTWCCSLVYGTQHRMPCDRPTTVVRDNVELKVETIPLPSKKNKAH